MTKTERVARAIFVALAPDYQLWDEIPDEKREDYIAAAHVTLSAMTTEEDYYRDVKPRDEHDQALIDAAWEKHKAAASEPKSLLEHTWLDPECGIKGCQSLIWKHRCEPLYAAPAQGAVDVSEIAREYAPLIFRAAYDKPTYDVHLKAIEELLIAALRRVVIDATNVRDNQRSLVGWHRWVFIRTDMYGREMASRASVHAFTVNEAREKVRALFPDEAWRASRFDLDEMLDPETAAPAPTQTAST